MPDDDAATLEQDAAVSANRRAPEPDVVHARKPDAAPVPETDAAAPAEEWLEDLSALPPRPRRRLLTPAPLALIAVLLLALGFLGGVLVEKGQTGSSTPTSGTALTSRLRGLTGSAGRTGAAGAAGAAGSAGSAGAAGAARPTSGTVSFVSGQTLYVTTGESNTVKVKASAATSVTKTVKSAVKSIHPGETVTVTGSSAANGTVDAESIRVGSTGGFTGLFGGGGGGKGTTGSTTGAGSEAQALFGSG
jgi:hypothetical protein